METHAQELHTSPGFGWKHYFFEFFMLFFAVFCGFLAENAREHVVKRNSANEYAQILCDELKKDTATLNYLIDYTHTFTGKFDTLLAVANEKSPGTSNGRLYWYSNFAAKIEQSSSGSSQIEQLKSSGNLRIKKTNVGQKITEYDRLIKILATDYSLSRAEYETMNQLRLKIFDFVFAIKFYPYAGQRKGLNKLKD
jgi:hypothetical protein